MKYLFLLFVICSAYSCQEESSLSLEPLKIEAVDNIPFLMTEKTLDSVFEIVTYGEINNLKKGDTLNYYRTLERNVISQQLRSLRCCSYAYVYNDDGLLVSRTKVSDVSEYYTLNYQRNKNEITVAEKGEFGDNSSIYVLGNERLIFRSKAYVSNSYNETTNFKYNSKNQLVEKSVKGRNHPEGDASNANLVTSYAWIDGVLNETHKTSYFADGINYFETITQFDGQGFPIATVVNKNDELICKTRIVRF